MSIVNETCVLDPSPRQSPPINACTTDEWIHSSLPAACMTPHTQFKLKIELRVKVGEVDETYPSFPFIDISVAFRSIQNEKCRPNFYRRTSSSIYIQKMKEKAVCCYFKKALKIRHDVIMLRTRTINKLRRHETQNRWADLNADRQQRVLLLKLLILIIDWIIPPSTVSDMSTIITPATINKQHRRSHQKRIKTTKKQRQSNWRILYYEYYY